jgi:hypothetical protein
MWAFSRRARLHLALFLTLAGCAASSDPRGGEAGPVVHGLSDQQAQFGNTFLPLAREFGRTKYAYAARTATGVQYEYLPEGETLDGWQHLATLTLVAVGRSWDDGKAILPKAVEVFRRGVRVLETSTFSGSAGVVAFTSYRIGGGAIEEYNLAATWQLTPGTLATFQVQQRLRAHTREQVEHFKSVAARIAQPSEARE